MIIKKCIIICLNLYFKLKLQWIARSRHVGVQDMTIAFWYSEILLKPSVIWDAITQKLHDFSNMDFFEETFHYMQSFSEISHNILFTHESPKIQNSAETFQRLWVGSSKSKWLLTEYTGDFFGFVFKGLKPTSFPFLDCISRKLVLNGSSHVTLRSCLWSIVS